MPPPRPKLPIPAGWIPVLLIFLLGASPATANRIAVRALDQLTGSAIAEASLTLPSAGRRDFSDATGWIYLDDLDAGIYEGILSGPGYSSRRLRIEVILNAPAHREEVFLTPMVHELSAFEVTTSLTDEDSDRIAERQSITPMDQVSGEQLQDIADQDLGDSLQKIAGVSIDSEGGSVSGINIRGAGPKQTRVTMDGQSLAGGGGRGTTRGAGAMNRIPKEFLDRVQVMKAPTPDMDADAIGGTVDLQTSRVSRTKRPRSTITARSSFQDAGGTFGHRFSVAHAQPFNLGREDRRMGLLVALSAQENDRLSDEIRILNQWPVRVDPVSGQEFPVLARLRAGSRQSGSSGYGIVLNSDLQLNKHNRFQLKFMWNSEDTSQSNQFFTSDFIRGRILSLSDRYGSFDRFRLEKQFYETRQSSGSGSLVLAGEHDLGNWSLEESIGFSVATSDSNDTQNATFQTGRDYEGSYDLEGSPALPRITLGRDGNLLTPEDLTDPEPFAFSRYDLIDDWAEDKETALRVNLQRKWDSGEAEWIFKTGIKARLRDASKDQDKTKYGSSGGFSLGEVVASSEASVFRGLYPIGPDWSAASMVERFLGQAEDFTYDPLDQLLDSHAGDFSVSEDIYATYGMIQRETTKWILIGGVRFERTNSRTTGFETITRRDEAGQRQVEVNPVSISDRYDMWFPGLHFLYRPSPRWIIRASLTRTLQRPDFRDLSPSFRIDLDTKRIRAGNPDLEPFDAKAIDIGTDFILNQYGSLSLGVFYKRIDDFIVDIEEQTDYLGEPGFLLIHPVNGSPADLIGIEATWNTDLTFLPGILDQTSLSANYTLTDSEAAYPGHPGEIIMLPQQVRQTLNLNLRWRYLNWTVSLSTRYRGLQLNDLTDPGQDKFTAGYWSHSASLSYKVNDTFSFSLGMSNLNRPDRAAYQGNPYQPDSTREGSRAYSLGVNIRFGGGSGSGSDSGGTGRDSASDGGDRT